MKNNYNLEVGNNLNEFVNLHNGMYEFKTRWVSIKEDVPPKNVEVLAYVIEDGRLSKARMMFTEEGWIMLEKGRSDEFSVEAWIVV